MREKIKLLIARTNLAIREKTLSGNTGGTATHLVKHIYFPQTLFFIGMCGGVSSAGILSDKFGRRFILIPLLFTMSSVGVAASYMPTFWSFVAMRFLHAFLYIGKVSIYIDHNYSSDASCL